ncbi:MAG: hypothetical protein AAF721_18965 [Myxococcota bacterium]
MIFCWVSGSRACGAAVAALALTACGPTLGSLDSEGEASDDAADSSSPSSNDTGDDGVGPLPPTTAPMDATDSGATFGDEASDDEDESDTDGGVTFIDPVDTGCGELPPGFQAHCSFECNVWEQDCPRGEKCMPWANDGGSSWNATRCSPIAAEPAAVGDACLVEGNGVSGIDDCDQGAMCFYVDSETNAGTCVAMCGGSPSRPTCDEGSACTVSGEGTLAVCLPSCNPLDTDCPDNQVCVPAPGGSFGCITQVEAPLQYGESCEALNECATGLACLNGEAVGCESQTCCGAFCSTADGDPNPACPDAAAGQTCSSVYEEGAAPPGFEDVGVCTPGSP